MVEHDKICSFMHASLLCLFLHRCLAALNEKDNDDDEELDEDDAYVVAGDLKSSAALEANDGTEGRGRRRAWRRRGAMQGREKDEVSEVCTSSWRDYACFAVT